MWKVYRKAYPEDTLADVYTFNDRDIMDDFLHDLINDVIKFSIKQGYMKNSANAIKKQRNYEESLITIVAKRDHEDWSREKITTRKQEFWKVEEVQQWKRLRLNGLLM